MSATVGGVSMPHGAAEAVREAGVSPSADVARIRAGLTSEALLAECLDGADPDRVEGWRDYVAAVFEVAS